MARISELHYSNAYSNQTGVSEFVEVALEAGEDPADYVVSFYNDDGSLGLEVALSDVPADQVFVDSVSGEIVVVISDDDFDFLITDPDSGATNNYEAIALTDVSTVPPTVIDFYDIGGGETDIVAQGGAADGAVSENIPTPSEPGSIGASIQFNEPDEDVAVFEPLTPGTSGVVCFAEDTLIDTADGPRRIQDLHPGDAVTTLDHGEQDIRWIGSTTRPCKGNTAPIRFEPGAIENTSTLRLSPQHRVLIRSGAAELLFARAELLVPAKALVNGRNIRTERGGMVTYYHLLFDQHEIIHANGALCESLHPGQQALRSLDDLARREVLAFFPQLAILDCTNAAPLARQALSLRQARLLREDRNVPTSGASALRTH